MIGNLTLFRTPFIPIVCAALLCVSAPAWAQRNSAVAELSTTTAKVGQLVEYRITISGSGTVNNLDVPKIDGVRMERTDVRRNYRMFNFQTTVDAIIVSYAVLPEREGTITFPPATVTISGQDVQTNELTLTVTSARRAVPNNPANPTNPPPSSPGISGTQTTPPPGQANTSELGFAELLIPKDSAYEGELIPAEIRFYIDANARPQAETPPSINGQGFTIQKFSDPSQSVQNIEGRKYYIITFKTAISAAKPGKLTIGPAEQTFVVPVVRKNRRSAFNDPFDDPFFFGPFGGVQNVQIKLESQPVELEIKPLPKKDRPNDFNGAVGQFTMGSEVTPKKAEVGEPVTLKVKIMGKGNFDRVTAPVLAEDPEWKAYPFTDSFVKTDEVGFTGTKTFEGVLTARNQKKATPAFSFSYFDPVAEKYITLEGAPQPVAITGEALKATPTPQAAIPSTPSAATPPPPTQATPTPAPSDILYIRPEIGKLGGSFAPAWQQSGFWLTQGIAAVLVLFTGLACWGAAKAGDASRKRAALLARQFSDLLAKMKNPRISAREFYAAAARFISLEASRDPANLSLDSVEEVAVGRSLSRDVLDEIAEIFRNRDAMEYGGGAGDVPVDPDLRQRVLAAVQAYQKAGPRTGAVTFHTPMAAAILLMAAMAGFAGAPEAQAQSPEAIKKFEEANKLYDSKDYKAAAKDYEYLAQTGYANANLYYNLGNAWYRLGESGKAILNYERALALDPSHPEAQANLKFVRRSAGTMDPDPSWWVKNLEAIGTNRLAWIAAGSFWAGAFFLVFAIFRLGNRRGTWVTLLVLAWLGVGAVAGPLWYYASTVGITNAGVVVSPDVKARFAPADSANVVGSVPIGSRVKLVSDRGSWVYVELSDGKTRGWIPTGTVESVRPGGV